mgnify:CR=1 FL=1
MKIVLFIITCFFTIALNAQANDWQDKIDASLWKKAEGGQDADFIIVLQQQADLADARLLQTKEEKGEYVFNTLRTMAQQSQKPILQILQDKQAQHESFFIINAIHVIGDKNMMRLLAERADVAYIADNPNIPLQRPTVESDDEVLSFRNAIEWGIQKIGADQVWALGYTGQGVVVGGQDTGYEWTHPLIQPKYRGWNGSTADHNYNWHDAIHTISPVHRDSIPSPSLNPCGLDAKMPCDDNSHGTHTMGTMVGDDGAGNQTGVAPGARWIGVRNMERGYGSPATYIEGFQWFIAPTDLSNKNPDSKKAPHVVNNSWGCPPLEGCNTSNFAMMNTVVNNVRAAGIVVVVSAGNSGSQCSTVSDPAAIFEGSFSVGASRQNDTIAGFSSRGPVLADNSGRLKPNVVAPGVGVRSAVRGGGYQSWNGTSMAGPHVAGLVALIISANPKLAGQVETIETLIEQTAKLMQTTENCGGVSGLLIPNNTYGYGRIDALAAVQRALQLTTDTNDLAGKIKITVSPNPFETEVLFKIEGVSGATELALFNASGQLIGQVKWEAQLVSLQPLNLNNLPSGIYFYRLKNGEAVTSGKIVKR